jgi:hypothetical protein
MQPLHSQHIVRTQRWLDLDAATKDPIAKFNARLWGNGVDEIRQFVKLTPRLVLLDLSLVVVLPEFTRRWPTLRQVSREPLFDFRNLAMVQRTIYEVLSQSPHTVESSSMACQSPRSTPAHTPLAHLGSS